MPDDGPATAGRRGTIVLWVARLGVDSSSRLTACKMEFCMRFLGLGASTLIASSLCAQPCTPEWMPGGSLPGLGPELPITSYPGRAMEVWDPDGPGPEPERLVIVGPYLFAGDK